MDSKHVFTELLSGATFGAALTASGVWSPATIIDQMHLQDFSMLKVFLTASSASALILQLLPQTSGAKCARPPSSLGLFGGYDGNVIGGAMVGIGMTLTGACPGTILVQITTGTYPSMYSFAGGLVGGILYTGLRNLFSSRIAPTPSKRNMTVYGEYHVKPNVAILAYVAFCATVVATTARFAPETEIRGIFLPHVVGGLIIGVAQLVSVILRGNPVGISTAYEELGALFWNIGQKLRMPLKRTEGSEAESKRVSAKHTLKATYFASGVMLGAFALTRLAPRFRAYITMKPMNSIISPIQAAAGGLIMVLGARIANGCTSGHGISGMSLLAKSSIVTVISMFAGGIGIAQLIRS